MIQNSISTTSAGGVVVSSSDSSTTATVVNNSFGTAINKAIIEELNSYRWKSSSTVDEEIVNYTDRVVEKITKQIFERDDASLLEMINALVVEEISKLVDKDTDELLKDLIVSEVNNNAKIKELQHDIQTLTRGINELASEVKILSDKVYELEHPIFNYSFSAELGNNNDSISSI